MTEVEVSKAQAGWEAHTMQDRERIKQEIQQLEDELADAWWREAPLEQIQQIEQAIEWRRQSLRPTPAGCA